MDNNYFTPLYKSLYKSLKTFGVSSKFFAIEIAAVGMIAFVIKAYILLVLVFIIHIAVAILNRKEPAWVEIFKFLIKIPDEDNAKLN